MDPRYGFLLSVAVACIVLYGPLGVIAWAKGDTSAATLVLVGLAFTPIVCAILAVCVWLDKRDEAHG